MLSGEQPAVTSDSQQPRSQAEQELAEFVSVVLADTEDTWTAIFQSANRRYEEPKLVLFSGAVQSACGFAQAAMGPFYCPADRKVYIDLMFYQDLRDRFGAPGDFAQAYVIAHEIEEALTATAARQDQGHVAPDSFTHGSRQQRVHWFRQGLQRGDMGSCDTFAAASLG